MSTIEKLRFYGDPILRERSEEVTEITPEIDTIIDELIECAELERSYGISAIQLGYPVRIFATSVDTWKPDNTRIQGTTYVYINPTLSDPSPETLVMEEGCMSIPGVYIPVERPRSITITAQDRNLQPFTQELSDIEARVRMHENDHLNGVLTPDRIPKSLRHRFEPELRALKKKYRRLDR